MGTLVSVAADNLGSHQIGGFKGSCTAARPCIGTAMWFMKI